MEYMKGDNHIMRFLDICAGVGGFRLGMEKAGHECIGYIETDPHCTKCKGITKQVPARKRNFTICTVCGSEKRQHARFSYEAIHDTEGELTGYDITTFTDNDFRLLARRGIDVLCAGIPCQPFSMQGKREGMEDIRGTLFFDVMRAAQQIEPSFLFFENVTGLLSSQGGYTFETMLKTMDELGYDAEWEVINSKDYVPQNRPRIYIIGHNRKRRTGKVFPIERTIREVPAPRTAGIRVKNNTSLGYDTAGENDSISLAFPNSKTRRGRVGRGCLQTLDKSCSQAIYDGGRWRRITPREAWRAQGFPDWAFDRAAQVNDDSQLYAQAGNSVTVEVIYQIARKLHAEKR